MIPPTPDKPVHDVVQRFSPDAPRLGAAGRPLHVAHVTATFPPYYAGTGNVCFHHARVLAERGHRVEVFTAAAAGDPIDPPGVTVHRYRPLLRLGNAPLVPQIALPRRVDLIHLHLPFIFGAELVWLRSLLRRTPLVVTVHNELRATGAKGRLFRTYDRLAGDRVLARAGVICAVTLPHAVSVAAIRQRRALGTPVVEVPHGVDVDRFRPGLDSSEIRVRLDIPLDAVVVTAVANLDEAHRFKRIDLAIRALAVADGPATLHLLVVGDGPLEADLRRLARAIEVADRVHFAGAVPHAAMPRYLAASNLLVLPSDAVESFGLVLIEAMACGKPVVTSDLPGPRSLVAHGTDGLVFPSGDTAALAACLKDLATSPDRRAAMGTAGRAKVERGYTWEIAGARLEEVYRWVLARRRASEQPSPPAPLPCEGEGSVAYERVPPLPRTGEGVRG